MLKPLIIAYAIAGIGWLLSTLNPVLVVSGLLFTIALLAYFVFQPVRI